MKGRAITAAIAMSLMLGAGAAGAATLRIGLQEDPDLLDPAQGGTFVGRMVFAGLCDKLVDIDAKLNFVPQLATEWTWSADNLVLTMKLRSGVVFHDGTPLNAEAAKYNIERYRTDPESRRRAELKPVKGVDVVDPMTVRINLSEPYAPLIAVLSDRAGMMLSPKATEAAAGKIANNPVCSGPFKFTERIAQERIVLDKFDGYWNKAAIHLDRIVFVPVPDNTVRVANLKAGQFEIIERVAATDLGQIRSDPRVKLFSDIALGYYTMSINLNNGEAANNAVAKNPKVREAFEAAIDRNVINQVVFNGEFVASNQAQPPGSTFYDGGHPVPPRDLARAKKLLAEAGVSRPAFTISTTNSPVETQVAQVVQSMVNEAGFDAKIETLEARTLVANTTKGAYQSAIVIWSGRPDPDGNIAIWLACDGFLNWGKYCNPKFDQALVKARSTTAATERIAHYKEAASIYLAERPHLFLYHYKLFWGVSGKVDGFRPYPDGIIRFDGMKLGS
ncbi:MAG: ABC transporter substrate-binding protein [Proteobacteria bacterium]|nr:ABC transporter substrate-binding protein [Pseudomonadota bacterium]